LLLVGFAGAFRRSDLVSLDVADLEQSRAGLVVMLRKSKTDQEAAGSRVGVPFGSSAAACPVGAVRTWLEAAGITSGPLFRPLKRAARILDNRLLDKAVARLVKRHALAIGLDPQRYAGHSLRASLATSAAAAGASERSIMAQTGHRSLPFAGATSNGAAIKRRASSTRRDPPSSRSWPACASRLAPIALRCGSDLPSPH
jgi:integrase